MNRDLYNYFIEDTMDLSAITLDAEDRRIPLPELWQSGPVLVVLLRHSGCPICREHLIVTEGILDDILAAGCRVVGVCLGSGQEAKALQDELALRFPVYGDQEQVLYRQLQMPRGSWWQVTLGPMLREPIKAVRRLRDVRKPGRDVRQLGGVVLLSDTGEVVYRYCQSDSADMPGDDEVMAAVQSLATRA